jgi:hypothetical protein
MSKAKFCWQAVTLAAQVGQIARQAKDMVDVYVDRGYGTTDALTEADVNQTPAGQQPLDQTLTLAQFQEITGVLVDLIAFYDGTAVATKDRGAVLNKYTRSDV